MMRAARVASSVTILRRSRTCSVAWGFASRSCVWPRIVVRGLLISCATPEASLPTADSFSAWMSCVWVRLSSSSWRRVSESRRALSSASPIWSAVASKVQRPAVLREEVETRDLVARDARQRLDRRAQHVVHVEGAAHRRSDGVEDLEVRLDGRPNERPAPPRRGAHRPLFYPLAGGARDEVVDQLERVVQFARVGTTTLSQVGSAAAPTAHDPGDLLHDPTRLEALGEVVGGGGDEVHLAVDDAPDADDARAETVAERVGDRAEAVGIEAVDPPGDHGDAVDLPRRRDQVLRAGARDPGLELRELLLEQPLLLEKLREPLRHLERRDLEDLRRLADRRLLPRHRLKRGAPRHGLHAPHP